MLIFLIYAIEIVDKINTVLELILILGFLSVVVLLVGYVFFKIETDENEADLCKKHVKKLVMILSPCLFLYLILPSSKTIGAMYLLPKIVSNENIQKIPEKALDVLNKKLDEWIQANPKE